MVIRGGERVQPREIAEVVFRHPRIQDVRTFGVPDSTFGAELCAWIRLRDGETLSEHAVRAS